MSKIPPKKKVESNVPDVELLPDAWERFEKAVDKVSKSPPQPKLKKPLIRNPKLAG